MTKTLTEILIYNANLSSQKTDGDVSTRMVNKFHTQNNIFKNKTLKQIINKQIIN
jgi:hypothetical protein